MFHLPLPLQYLPRPENGVTPWKMDANWVKTKLWQQQQQLRREKKANKLGAKNLPQIQKL